MFNLQKISQSKSQTLVWFLIWFILGVALASAFDLKRIFLFKIYFGLIILLVFSVFFWPKKEIRLLVFGGIFLFLGMGRFLLSEPPLDQTHLRFYNGRLVEIEGSVAVEVEKENKQTVIIKSDKVKIVNSKIDGDGVSPFLPKVEGRVIQNLSLYPQYRYGDKLKIVCELAEPQKNQGFDYPAYLAKEGVWSICQNPQVGKNGEGGGSFLMKIVLGVKNALISQVNQILPESQASFLGGLLYGARSSIAQDLQNAFNRTGTTHIIAISGYNITIIATALLALFKGLWIPRKKAFWLAVGGIVFFVFLTGASASVARAGLMGIIVLLARQWGRQSQVGRVLLLAAALMLLFNPRVLFFDAGFQLSFAATLGLVYLSPLLESSFQKWPNPFGLKEALFTTLSAIIATLPLILYQFGRFSVVAPLTNLLILPVIPLTMAIGFGAVVLNFIFSPLGQLAGFLAWLPLTYIIKVVEFFSAISWAAVELPPLPWWGMAGMYAVIIATMKRYKKFLISKS